MDGLGHSSFDQLMWRRAYLGCDPVGMDDELSQTGKSVLWFIGMNLLVHYTITKAILYIYIYIPWHKREKSRVRYALLMKVNRQKHSCTGLPLFLFSFCHMVELVHALTRYN